MSYSMTLGALAFLLAVIWGTPLIRFLKRQQLGKRIRMEGPQSHMVKAGTPTMGGLLIILPVVFITVGLNLANLLGFTLIGESVLVPVFSMVSFGLLGLLDDIAGIRRRRGDAQGLLARSKFPAQVALALFLALVMYYRLDLHSIALPTVPQRIDINGLWIPIAVFIITGTANSVNFADGLDGLAGSLAAVCYVAYGIIAYLQGQVWLAALCFTIVGATFAFLWFNAHPAELFMGDVGSMALGATLGVVALMTGQWLLLPIIGFPFLAETLSVILQVGSAKFSRRFLGRDVRPFKMAPLHHHFELLGWSETQVTQRFFLIGLLSGMLGIALALL
ncbi:MAG: phospho-N-acetylmuramoyl-pentapeptide-transferase [Anaerolineae bacterium]|nr:phospho-N-acetylmuramoyl-pentapeptide-transferase [Caldilineales bacterium]MDW8268597.1 phospho-N-acetylmuramoyl-pentapeptide-transferase [Anaerolineae bacterium]